MRALLITTLLLANTAHGDVIVEFRDGAPKDRFTITNTDTCATGPVDITFDLAPSPFGLIFDVTGTGAGVEVFQPFEVTAGGDLISGVSELSDGDQTLTLTLLDLRPDAQVSFTIDLDDTVGTREITVNGAEIAGAKVMISSDSALAEGAFDDTGRARVIVASCAA